jgi:TatD DNase family protein
MLPPLIDVGANLTKAVFEKDYAGVMDRAAKAGVVAIIVTGTTVQASRLAADRAPKRDQPLLFATAGVHPHHAQEMNESHAISALRELLGRPRVVAVGECGLDYNRDYSPRDVQRRMFEAQLELAADVRKPVFLHDRDATTDFVDILKRYRQRLTGGVVHCFTGNRDALDRYLDLDMHIGITGWICDERRGTHLYDLVKLVPRGRLLVETDAPFLYPRDLPESATSVRRSHARNEPAIVAHVARTVAKHRGETYEDLAEHTTAAARALFGMSTVALSTKGA